MISTFISAVSLQSGRGLQKLVYEPYDFEFNSRRETSFPIIPVIEHYMENPQNTRVILLRSENPNVKDNYGILEQEVLSLGVPQKNIIPMRIEERSGKDECVEMLLKLIDKIEEDSVVYTDITYQTKPISATMLYAMNLVEKIKDVEVGGIFYGEVPRWTAPGVSDNTGILYDITVFKNLIGIAEQLKALEVSDLRGVLGKLCGVECND